MVDLVEMYMRTINPRTVIVDSPKGISDSVMDTAGLVAADLVRIITFTVDTLENTIIIVAILLPIFQISNLMLL